MKHKNLIIAIIVIVIIVAIIYIIKRKNGKDMALLKGIKILKSPESNESKQ